MTTTGTLLGGANRHKSSVGDVSGLASCQVWEAGSGHCGESSKHLRKFRVGTLNVNTLRGRECEVVETLSRRKVDVCCIQETRYRGGNCRIIKGKDMCYEYMGRGGQDMSTNIWHRNKLDKRIARSILSKLPGSPFNLGHCILAVHT